MIHYYIVLYYIIFFEYTMLTIIYRLSCFLLVCMFSCTSFTQNYLTKVQWKHIQNIIRNPNTLQSERDAVNNILYQKYCNWAYNKAFTFKQLHKYKCLHISIDELKMYSSSGLLKAIRNYNASYDFHNYADICITGELYKGMTDLYPITTIPRAERIKRQLVLKPRVPTAYIGKEEWRLSKSENYDQYNSISPLNNIIEYDRYKECWRKIDKLDPFSKKVMYYKFDFYFTKIRTNKEIAVLMVCSEEHVRKYIKKSLMTILL